MSQDLKREREFQDTGSDLNEGVPRSLTLTANPDGATDVNPFREKVRTVLSEIEKLLVAKNEAYGNSALDPINVFSMASAVEQLKVRIDDKLNRLYRGKEYGSEDTVTDLLGYLVLLKIAEAENEQ